MDIPEARFNVGLDASPIGPTVAIEVYSRENSDGLGYLREMESLVEMKERNPEQLLLEEDPEEHVFRFELDQHEVEGYYRVLRQEVERREADFLTLEDAVYRVELFSSPGEGIRKETYMARYDDVNVPESVIQIFSGLRKTAYENIID